MMIMWLLTTYFIIYKIIVCRLLNEKAVIAAFNKKKAIV